MELNAVPNPALIPVKSEPSPVRVVAFTVVALTVVALTVVALKVVTVVVPVILASP